MGSCAYLSFRGSCLRISDSKSPSGSEITSHVCGKSELVRRPNSSTINLRFGSLRSQCHADWRARDVGATYPLSGHRCTLVWQRSNQLKGVSNDSKDHNGWTRTERDVCWRGKSRGCAG